MVACIRKDHRRVWAHFLRGNNIVQKTFGPIHLLHWNSLYWFDYVVCSFTCFRKRAVQCINFSFLYFILFVLTSSVTWRNHCSRRNGNKYRVHIYIVEDIQSLVTTDIQPGSPAGTTRTKQIKYKFTSRFKIYIYIYNQVFLIFFFYKERKNVKNISIVVH